MKTIKDKLIRILVEDKMISEEDLDKALEVQKKDGGPN